MSVLNTVRYGLSLNTTILDDSTFDQCWIEDNSGGPSYVDETTDANSTTTADVPLAGYGDSNDCIYVGDSATFAGLFITLSTAATVGTRVLEYWDGDSWELCETQTVTTGGISLIGTTHTFFWYPSANWATRAVNSVTKYYVRLRVTGVYTVVGTISWISVSRAHTEWTKTVYIPENSNRTFKSAFIRALAHTTFSDYPYWCLFVKVGSGTRTGSGLDRGNSSAGVLTVDHFVDLASDFNTKFGAGTSQDIKVMLVAGKRVPSSGSRYSCGQNASGEIVLTYEADAQQTRIKTVCIPIESQTGDTTTSLTEIGTNQWPDLSTFCPEASKTFREMTLQFKHSHAFVASGYLSYAIDSESATDLSSFTASYSDSMLELFWVRNDVSTSAAHAIKVKHTTASAFGRQVGGFLWVTYEYDHTNSTTILNSIRIAGESEPTFSGDTEAEALEVRVKFMVNEPATVTLVQSAVHVLAGVPSAGSVPLLCGSQSARTYGSGDTRKSIMHRVDSGGAQGAGLTFARGLNTLTCRAYQSSASYNLSFYSFVAIINYTSAKASGGEQTHNKTHRFPIQSVVTTGRDAPLQYSIALPLPASYYLSSVSALCFSAYVFYQTQLMILRAAGEGNAKSGPAIMFPSIQGSSFYFNAGYCVANRLTKAFPTDPRWGAIDSSASHTWELLYSSATKQFSCAEFTFHSITETVTGTVSGYTGDGSGLTVDIFRVDGDEYIGSATTAAGGTYTFTWYSDNDDLYATCRQSDALCGRSTDGKAS